MVMKGGKGIVYFVELLYFIFAISSISDIERLGWQIYRRTKTPAVAPFLEFVEKEFGEWVRTQIRENPSLINIWVPHLMHSRELIEKAARYALSSKSDDSPSRVLVIGAGNCLDIPLKKLTQMFDEVYLLDLAYGTIRNIAEEGVYYELGMSHKGWSISEEKLTPEERVKLSPVIGDASGGVALEIAHRAENWTEGEHINKEQLLGLIEGLKFHNLPFPDGYFDFVVSSLVLSDLLELPEIYILEKLSKLGQEHIFNDIDWGIKLIQLNEQVGRYHIEEVYRLLKPQGRFYISAARFRAEVFRAGKSGSAGDFLPQGYFIHHLTREVTMPEDLTTLVQRYFFPIPEEQPERNMWLWQNSIDQAISVQSLILSKKKVKISELSVVPPTSQLVETLKNICSYSHPVVDTILHILTRVDLAHNILNDHRLRALLRSEFEHRGVEFGDNFNPCLYSTTLVFLNRKDVRAMFIGDEFGVVSDIEMKGNVIFTRLVRVGNGTSLNDVHFYGPNYVGEGWRLEGVKAGRVIFSDGKAETGEVLLSELKKCVVVQSYMGAGAVVEANLLKNTVIPEGRIFKKRTEITGIMSEEIVLADYLQQFPFCDVIQLLEGKLRIPGSDIDTLPYSGRLTSLATAFCILIQKGEEELVNDYLISLPPSISEELRERMLIVSIFVDLNLFKTLFQSS